MTRAEEAAAPDRSPKDSAAAQALLLDGVRAFRSERFDEALRLFQRVQSEQQPADIGLYLGMALHKLGRHLEALVAFRTARRAGVSEPIADYYRAVSCYRLGMFARARQSFTDLLTSSAQPASADSADSAPILGPRLQQGAQRFLQTLDQALLEAGSSAAPQKELLSRRYETARLGAERLHAVGNEEAALEWLDEAARLLPELSERADKLPALRQQLMRLRAGGRLAPSELQAIEVLLGPG